MQGCFPCFRCWNPYPLSRVLAWMPGFPLQPDTCEGLEASLESKKGKSGVLDRKWYHTLWYPKGVTWKHGLKGKMHQGMGRNLSPCCQSSLIPYWLWACLTWTQDGGWKLKHSASDVFQKKWLLLQLWSSSNNLLNFLIILVRKVHATVSDSGGSRLKSGQISLDTSQKVIPLMLAIIGSWSAGIKFWNFASHGRKKMVSDALCWYMRDTS